MVAKRLKFGSTAITMSPGSLSEKYVHTVGVLDVKMVSFKDCTNCGLFTAAL